MIRKVSRQHIGHHNGRFRYLQEPGIEHRDYYVISPAGSISTQVTQHPEAPIARLEGVSKRYPQGKGWIGALDAVDLAVYPGRIHGIIGFSGAGKSTLLRAIAGVETPDRGRVLIAGNELTALHGEALRRARRNLGVVLQQLHLLRSRTVFGNVALPLELAGATPGDIASRVHELLGWFGLKDKAAQYPSQLSGGQRQRVAIARALALRPAMLLTDEPTSALDAETTASVLDLLRRIRDEFGVAVLLITHDLEAVRAICDHVSVLDAGRIVEEGPVQEVLLRPRSSAARKLLNAELGYSVSDFPPDARAGQPLVLELQFIGAVARESILGELVKHPELDVKILRGRVDQLHNTPYGFLLLELSGDAESLDRALDLLRKRGVGVRWLGGAL